MRRVESHTDPFFGHHPQDFGILQEPPRLDKEGRQIELLNVADKMEAMERLYERWLQRPGSRWRLRFASEPVRIFREQIHLLIRAYSQSINELNAAQQQVGQVQSNLPQIRKRQELRNFLLEQFPGSAEAAEFRNQDLIDVCMGIMLDQKQELAKRS